MQKALVLGGASGLLGQALVSVLTQTENWQVKSLGRSDINVFDEKALAAFLKEFQPDVVFNTIAWTQVDDAEDHPDQALEVNATFAGMLARLLAQTSCFLLHFSTDFVFGSHSQRLPLTETDTPAPESVYGRTKLAGEQEIFSFLPKQAAVLRTAWLFGPWKKNFITTILQLAQKKKQLTVVADQCGSPTYTLDLARWSAVVAEKRAYGLFHAVNAGQASWFEFASKAIQLAHIDCTVLPITSSQWPQKAKRPPYSVLSTTKLANILDTSAFLIRPWEEALAEYIEQFMS